MNNKQIGTKFEHEMCEYLKKEGWWVHFITPDARGAQPFDIIAVKDNLPMAIDCKTSTSHIFPFSRLEDNQIMAFEHWMRCGNTEPIIVVKYKESICLIQYSILKQYGKINLNKDKWGYCKICRQR